jgi:hypothetical protein
MLSNYIPGRIRLKYIYKGQINLLGLLIKRVDRLDISARDCEIVKNVLKEVLESTEYLLKDLGK